MSHKHTVMDLLLSLWTRERHYNSRATAVKSTSVREEEGTHSTLTKQQQTQSITFNWLFYCKENVCFDQQTRFFQNFNNLNKSKNKFVFRILKNLKITRRFEDLKRETNCRVEKNDVNGSTVVAQLTVPRSDAKGNNRLTGFLTRCNQRHRCG